MGIEILPPEAITKLQSGIIITDAIQCILELVRKFPHFSLDYFKNIPEQLELLSFVGIQFTGCSGYNYCHSS